MWENVHPSENLPQRITSSYFPDGHVCSAHGTDYGLSEFIPTQFKWHCFLWGTIRQKQSTHAILWIGHCTKVSLLLSGFKTVILILQIPVT